MKTLILGGNGRTGKLVVQELLKAKCAVRLLVRDRKKLPEELLSDPSVECVEGSITALTDDQLEGYVRGCSTVVSCLGTNPTFGETYRGPKNLVAGSTERIHDIAKKLHESSASVTTRFILMNGALIPNKKDDSPQTWGQWIVSRMMRLLVPPFRDNIAASNFLQAHPHTPGFEWTAIRPGQLLDKPEVGKYTVTSSPSTSLAETTLRINVADMIKKLIVDDNTWEKWNGKMPVVYDQKA